MHRDDLRAIKRDLQKLIDQVTCSKHGTRPGRAEIVETVNADGQTNVRVRIEGGCCTAYLDAALAATHGGQAGGHPVTRRSN